MSKGTTFADGNTLQFTVIDAHPSDPDAIGPFVRLRLAMPESREGQAPAFGLDFIADMPGMTGILGLMGDVLRRASGDERWTAISLGPD